MTPQHKAGLLHEAIGGLIVLCVVAAATVVELIQSKSVPGDLLGFVYGGAITYAGGRVSAVRASLTRRTDTSGTMDTGTT